MKWAVSRNPARRTLRALGVGLVLALGLAACGGGGGSAAGGGGGGSGEQLEVAAFRPPSLGAFLPAIIEARDLDAEHDLDLKFTYATPDNYYAEFAAGHYQVGSSAALLTTGRQALQGADVTSLFNMFDFFGAAVTSNPDIQKLKDLEGHSLAAATGTTNYAMFSWFAQQNGVDLSKVKTMNQTTSGLSTMALSGRADAVQLWEPAYSSLITTNDDIRTLDMGLPELWEQEFGTTDIPYLGVAAQREWADSNPETVQKLYDTYKAAADWVQANPGEAAQIVADTLPDGNADVIEDLIDNRERLAMRVVPTSEVTEGVDAVFEAGQQSGYLEGTPPAEAVYEGLK